MIMSRVTVPPLADRFRVSMRRVASSVSIVSAADDAGTFHGIVVTSATALSMDPPSMMVAINRNSYFHPVISGSGRFCLNLLSRDLHTLVDCFSRGELHGSRFTGRDWTSGPGGLPVLTSALAVHVCTVVEAHEFGSHTVFFGHVDDLFLAGIQDEHPDPLVWLNGTCAEVRSGHGE